MQSIKDLKRNFLSLADDTLPYHWLEGWLLFVLQKDKLFLILHDDYVLTKAQQTRLDEGLAKMRQGVPLAYLMGEQDFFGRTFLVDGHTLIPRPDTEILIETVLAWLKSPQNAHKTTGKLLDLGTGTGCIAITLAKELPAWSVLAVDFSLGALDIAKQNATRLQADNCTLVQSDWFGSVAGEFDVIVSNPPYIAKHDEHLTALTHEPITALVADDDGLADIRHIIAHACQFLQADGLLVIEHGHDQGDKVRQIFEQHGYFGVKTVQDYGKNDRLTLGVYRG